MINPPRNNNKNICAFDCDQDILTKTDYRSLDFVLMRFLIKLFCTSNSVIVNECRMYFNFRLPSEIVPTRSVKVMLKLSNVAEA